MPFVKDDPNINRAGRPTNEQRPILAEERLEKQELSAAELTVVLKRLRRASPKAIQFIIDAMSDEDIPKKDRLKHAKDVYDMYLKTIGVDLNVKRGGKASLKEEDGEEEIKPPAVVFTLYKTGLEVNG